MERIMLQDRSGKEVAEIEMHSNENGWIAGTIIQKSCKPEQENEFKEFEELVNSQVFSLLDEIADQIDANGYQIKDKGWQLYDIQIFEGKNISFRIHK